VTSSPARVAVQGSVGDPPGRRDGWHVVAALAISQTVGYGVLYYAFAVFLGPLAADLHTSPSVVTGAAALAVLTAAATAYPVGRGLDHHGGRGLMTAGAALGTIGVLAWSQVQTVGQLYGAFALIGLASAMSLYEPAFAVIVRRFGPGRRPNALLAVTIVAGFASTIFLPLAGVLEALLGWRAALVVLAGVHAALTIPLHALALPRRPDRPVPTPPRRSSAVRIALRGRGFWLLVLAFVAQGAAMAVIAVHLVAYLVTLGHAPAFAAGTAGLLGVLSVTGRLVTTGLRRRYPTATVTAAVFALQGAAAAALPIVGRDRAGAIICILLFGLGFGVATISRPALLAERYDASAYGTLAGALAAPATLAKASAPLAAAALATTAGGYTLVLGAVAVSCLLAAAALGPASRERSDR
jgi:predicted MFS family arabinose efflux permease